MTRAECSELIIGIGCAVMSLDENGGWDHTNISGWPDFNLWKRLRVAVQFGYVEESVMYGAGCWRLTDTGISLQKEMRQWYEHVSSAVIEEIER